MKNSTNMLLGISPGVPYIKKSIRYEMQHLMQIDELPLNFKNRNSKSKKWVLLMLSVTVKCCRNIHILIRNPLEMKFLHLLWKFHGYIFHGLGEK